MTLSYLNDFFSLFYPRLCNACNKALIKEEQCICSFCKYQLPKTRFHLERENQLTRVFWGRVNIETATSLLYYHKGSMVQNLIHRFKYKGKKDIGVYLGNMLGSYLKDSPLWQPADVIVPVPLHEKKFHQRGFNQSEVFATGLSEIFKKPMLKNNLIRISHTQTQTRKTRFKRWENVSTVFDLRNPDDLRGKNVLIVDDVVTTGSTLESCCEKILSIQGTRVWVATIAMAY